MLLQFWNDAIIPALITIATAAASVLAAYAANALRKWGARQKALWVKSLMDGLADSATTAVASVNQTFADDIRKAREDGKLTPAEASEAMRRALQALVSHLGDDGMALLLRALGNKQDVNAALENSIESAVYHAKVH